MIKNIYNRYFQKSKSFLYPILGIRKNGLFTPSGTYLAIPGLFELDDVKFICTFDKNDSEGFIAFEQRSLLSHPLFFDKIETESQNIYVFNYELYVDDWFNVITGKYSKLSNTAKRLIKQYFGESSNEYKHLHVYLNPKEHFYLYAQLLNTDVDVVRHSGELCDEPSLEKESLHIPAEVLADMKKTI